jgi:beta-lactamase regulating signal transducer with metallopeptidase domain
MTAVAWLSREEIVALGWALLHFCWQGTAIALAYAVVDRLTSNATSRVRYAVTLVALLLMPAAVLGTFALELHTVTPSHAFAGTAPVASVVPLTLAPEPILHELPLASSLQEQTDWFAMRADRMLPWVVALWLSGVLLLALRSLGGWWQLGLVRRRAGRMVPQEVQRAFLRLCEQIHAGRKVVLRASDEVISPLAMGVWHATVILPISAVLSLPREELEAVLAHELGHIRRWDYLWNLLQTAIESVLFFHPAVWWLSRTVRDRREVCCDEIAVRSCAGPAVYARALLRLEEQRTARLSLAMSLGGCGGSLLGRVRKVLGEDMAMESRMTSGVSAAAIGALVIALLLGPKFGEAKAAPVISEMQPEFAQVMAQLPSAVLTEIDGPGKRLIIPTQPPKAAVHPQPAAATTLWAQVFTPAPPAPQATPAPAPAPVATPAPQAWPAPAPHAMPAPSPSFAGAFAAPKAPWPTPQVYFEAPNSPDLEAAIAREMEIQAGATSSAKGSSYLDGMKDAGYPIDLNGDLNTLVSLKSVGVTPEYAKAMAQAGLGKPDLHELVVLKSVGVTPEYVAGMKQSGLAPKDFHELITEKSLGVTPEYATEMKQKGFGNLTAHELITMKALGVTPEYAAAMKQQGFGNLDVHELITMKAQGMTPEYAGWLKQHFPQATPEQLQRAAVFHLNDKFVADAKSHGFDTANLDKLLKLKMSGLLDD